MKLLKQFTAGVGIAGLILSLSFVPLSPVPIASGADPALVQQQEQSSGGYVNSFTIVYDNNVTAGNTLYLALTRGATDTISSIADNRSNTWTLADEQIGGARATAVYYAKNVNAGATTITVTYTAGKFPDTSAIAREYSNTDSSAPLDVKAKNSDGGVYVQTHPTGTTLTTTTANGIAIAACGSDGSVSPVFAAKVGYGNLTEQKGFDAFTYQAVADKVYTSAGTQNGDMTTTEFVTGQCVIITFKAAAASTPERAPIHIMIMWLPEKASDSFA